MLRVSQESSYPVSYPDSEPWQDISQTISSAFYYMMKLKIGVDVIFKKDNLPCLYAHKLILSLWSPYFEDLMKQTVKGDVLTVNFSQDIDAMKTVLHYIYSYPSAETYFTKMPIEKIIQVIEITERFQIKQIHQRCISSLQRRKIIPENVMEFFDYGLKKGLETIVKKCCKVFLYQGVRMKNLRQDISVHTLLAFLSFEKLAIQSESRLLNIAVSWLSYPLNKSFKPEVLSRVDLSAIEWNEYQDFCKKFPNFFSESELTSILMAVAHRDMTRFPCWYKPKFSSIVEKNCDTCILVNKRMNMPNITQTKHKQNRDFIDISQAFEFRFQHLPYARLHHIEFPFEPSDVKHREFRVKFSKSGTGNWEEGHLDTPLRSSKYVLIFQEPLMLKNDEGLTLKFHFWKGLLKDRIQLIKLNNVKSQQLKDFSKKDIVEIEIKSSKLAYYCKTEEFSTYFVSSFYFSLCENHVPHLIRKRIEYYPEKAVVKMEAGCHRSTHDVKLMNTTSVKTKMD